MADASSDTKRPAPPYIAFQTLKTLTQNMKADGVPGRIDKTMLSNFSGAVASQLMTALKFLDLTDQDGHPTDSLRTLVAAYGTDEWPSELAGTIKRAFAPVFTLNLETATPGQFTERFSASFDGEGDTLRKAITFFVNAVREAQIPISSYIMKNKKPRSGANRKRMPRATTNGASRAARTATGDHAPPPPPQITKTPYEVLMHEIYDPMMMEPGSEEEKAVFTLARFLRTKEVGQ